MLLPSYHRIFRTIGGPLLLALLLWEQAKRCRMSNPRCRCITRRKMSRPGLAWEEAYGVRTEMIR